MQPLEASVCRGQMWGPQAGVPVYLCVCLLLRGWAHRFLPKHTHDTVNV